MRLRNEERDLLALLPFTNEERRQVRALFQEERRLIHERQAGREFNLTGERHRIAQARVEITRRARRRLSR